MGIEEWCVLMVSFDIDTGLSETKKGKKGKKPMLESHHKM